MHRVLRKKILREGRKDSSSTLDDSQNKAKYRPPVSLILIYCLVVAVFLSVGTWLVKDLISSHASIIAERSVFAVQTSELMSQQFGNTLTATDYVLRDVTTKVTVDELNLASSNLEVRTRLSALVREKLATLPHVTGLGFLDSHRILQRQPSGRMPEHKLVHVSGRCEGKAGKIDLPPEKVVQV